MVLHAPELRCQSQNPLLKKIFLREQLREYFFWDVQCHEWEQSNIAFLKEMHIQVIKNSLPSSINFVNRAKEVFRNCILV